MSTGNHESTNAFEFKFDGRNDIPSEEALQAEVAGAGVGHEDLTASPATTPTAGAADGKEAPASGEPRTHKITVNGEELEVSEEDLKAGHMRLRDYTQKTQKFAQEKREWETKVKADLEGRVQTYEQELAALDQFLQDKEAIQAYMQRAFAEQQQAVEDALEGQGLTPAQVSAIARREAEQAKIQALQAVNQEMTRREQALAARQAYMAQRTQLETEINSHIATLFEKYPALKEYDGIEDELMADAAKRMTSPDMNEAKQRLAEAAERKIAWAKSIASEEKKAAAVAAAKLTKNGIEPSGGTGIKSQAGKKLSLDNKDKNALLADITAELTAMQSARK